MIKDSAHFNLPDLSRWKNRKIDTRPASSENAISKEYYYFLVGEINHGTIFAAVVRVPLINENWSYHLISDYKAI